MFTAKQNKPFPGTLRVLFQVSRDAVDLVTATMVAISFYSITDNLI